MSASVSVIENHMVLPVHEYVGPEPEREEQCVSCHMTGYLIPDGWCSATRIETDDDGTYLVSDGDLPDAESTPLGWVCSQVCRSQAMYDHADEWEKRILRRVHDACRVLAEDGRIALRLVDDAMGEAPDGLAGLAAQFLEAVGDDVDDMPSWCNRPVEEVSRG